MLKELRNLQVVQGYDDRLDESLGASDGKKSQSF